MRVSSYAVARPNYYDRNATATNLSYNDTAAPHGATTRFIVTVAAGKKLYMEVLAIAYFRATAASAAGQQQAYSASYDGVTESVLLYDSTYNNTTLAGAGPLQRVVVSSACTVYAGQSIYTVSSDGSTAGTIAFRLAGKGTTFDA